MPRTKKENSIWLLVRVDSMFHTPQATAMIRMLGLNFRHGDDGTVSGSHGVKVGLYTSHAKAVAAYRILRRQYDEKRQQDLKVLQFPVRHQVLRQPPEETTWMGDEVFGMYTFEPENDGDGDLTLAPPPASKKAYLVVQPIDYRDMKASRRMELYVAEDEKTATRIAKQLKHGFPRESFGVMPLPVDEDPTTTAPALSYDSQPIVLY